MIDPQLGFKKSLEKNLSNWIKAFQELKSNLTFTFVVDNALTTLDDLIILGSRFDVIDTSNVADHCGLLNLLIPAAVLLRNTCSVVNTCSFLLNNFADSREEYIQTVTSLPPSSFPTLLGLNLEAPNEQWQSQIQPFRWSMSHSAAENPRGHYYFYWTKATTPAMPISLSSSPFLVSALVSCAANLCSFSTQKLEVPGTAYVTPASFARILAFSFATQRLGAFEGYNTFPFPDPTFLWEQLEKSESLLGTMGELFTCAQVLGFPVNTPTFKNSFPLFLEHEFPLPKNVVSATLQIHATTGPVTHYFTSLGVSEQKGKLNVKVFLPEYVSDNLDTASVTLFTNTPTTLGVPHFLPVGNPFPLKSLKLKQQRDNLATSLFSPLTKAFAAKKFALDISTIEETDTGFSVKVLLSPSTKDMKIALDEKEPYPEVHLQVGDYKLEIPLTWPVTTTSVKIHRKSMFILLLLKKRDLLPSPQFLCIESLPKTSLDAPTLGAMFTKEEFDWKKSTSKEKSSVIFDLKENIQIILKHYYDKASHVAIVSDTMIPVGLVVFHECYFMPPVDSAHDWTPLLDVSFSFSEGLNGKELLKLVGNGPFPQLKLPEKEIVLMKQLFDNYCRVGSISNVHPKVGALQLGNLFKRCALHPLYPAAGLEQGFITKTMKKDRDITRKGNQTMKDLTASLRSKLLNGENFDEKTLATLLRSLKP